MERDGQFLVINIQWEILWLWQGTASNFDTITSSRTPSSIPRICVLTWLTLWPLRWEADVPLKCQAFYKQHCITIRRKALFTVTCNISISLSCSMLMDNRKNNIFAFSWLHITTTYRNPILKWPYILHQRVYLLNILPPH
jgi:hypothetical protein